MKREIDLRRLDGVSDKTAGYMQEEGINSIRDLKGIEKEELMEIKYMKEDRAIEILNSLNLILEQMEKDDLIYHPTKEEYVEEEPENWICDCGSPFPEKSVLIAHGTICDSA